MIPAVRVPANAVLPAVEIKLKPGWQFDPDRQVFVSDRGAKFQPTGLPRKSQIVHKTPALLPTTRPARSKLSENEKKLLRCLQVILPRGEPQQKYAKTIRDWESVAEVSLPPEPSLPTLSL